MCSIRELCSVGFKMAGQDLLGFPAWSYYRAACIRVEVHSRSWAWSDGAPGKQQMLLVRELVGCLLAQRELETASFGGKRGLGNGSGKCMLFLLRLSNPTLLLLQGRGPL